MLRLTSKVFGDGETIPAKYTCVGKDINPQLEINGVTGQTRSLVLIMEDHDVSHALRADGMWDHWLRYNIPPETTIIVEGTEPEGESGLGTSRNKIYHGPCPPDGEHRYFFKLYALDTVLSFPKSPIKKELLAVMKRHILEKTVLMGR